MAEEQDRSHDERWLALSALADGEAAPAEQGACLSRWSEDPDCRSRWHAYQVAGDVMRSAELAHGAADDAAFLSALKSRLAQEPPRAHQADTVPHRMPRWMAPVAMAAGVGAVALTLNSLWPGAQPAGPDVSTAAVPATSPATLAASPPSPPQFHVVNGQLIRDARLDRYLAAHRQGAAGAALQMPGAVVRSVDTIVLDDR